MGLQNRIVSKARNSASGRTVRTEGGELMEVPEDWSFLPAGDGPLTKMVKAKGPTWQVRLKVRKRFISQGIWAKAEHIKVAARELADKRATPDYARKRRQQLALKERQQQEYKEEFCSAVFTFLDFAPRYRGLAEKFSHVVTEFATPVGSGTVARTRRLPIEDRARSGVIAWMRHQTTDYERMSIARVKGRRRQVRRELAQASLELLRRYRNGEDCPPSCPLQQALRQGTDDRPQDGAGRALTTGP